MKVDKLTLEEAKRKISAENIIQGDFDCSAINQWRSVFVEKEDCQKYCDWLNAEEMKI